MKTNKLKSCYGCKHLTSYADGAGGGSYKCDKTPGLAVGEWGHWTDETDEPTHDTSQKCYEERVARWQLTLKVGI